MERKQSLPCNSRNAVPSMSDVTMTAIFSDSLFEDETSDSSSNIDFECETKAVSSSTIPSAHWSSNFHRNSNRDNVDWDSNTISSLTLTEILRQREDRNLPCYKDQVFEKEKVSLGRSQVSNKTQLHRAKSHIHTSTTGRIQVKPRAALVDIVGHDEELGNGEGISQVSCSGHDTTEDFEPSGRSRSNTGVTYVSGETENTITRKVRDVALVESRRGPSDQSHDTLISQVTSEMTQSQQRRHSVTSGDSDSVSIDLQAQQCAAAVAVAYLVEEESGRRNSSANAKDMINKNPKLYMVQNNEKEDSKDEVIEKESLKKSVQFWRGVVIAIALIVLMIIVFSTLAASMRKSRRSRSSTSSEHNTNGNVPTAKETAAGTSSSNPKKSPSKKNNSNRVLLIEAVPDGRVKRKMHTPKSKGAARFYSKGSKATQLLSPLTSFSQNDPQFLFSDDDVHKRLPVPTGENITNVQP